MRLKRYLTYDIYNSHTCLKLSKLNIFEQCGYYKIIHDFTCLLYPAKKIKGCIKGLNIRIY